MYKYTILLSLFVAFAISGCVSVNEMSIDQLRPAEICFPQQVKKVAIVSTMSENDIKSDLAKPIKNYDVAKKILANRIADANYFDNVIICDSLVNDSLDNNGDYLSQNRVISLLDDLDSDMLISFDKLNVSLLKITDTTLGAPFDAVLCVVTPELKFYISKKKTPMYIVHQSDSTLYNIEDLVDQAGIINESVNKAISKSVNLVVPYWNNTIRRYYTGGTYEMRDAEVAIKENDWESALRLWTSVYDNKNGKLKYAAAYNIAVYYEIQDNIVEALKWLSISMSGKKLNSELKEIAENYKIILLQRQKDLNKLKIQMERFKLNN